MTIRRLIAGMLAAGAFACAHSPQSLSEHHEASVASHPSVLEAASRRIDFAAQVQPILENRCQPCHFPGGQLYERLPFDRGETVVHLGEKLFTRIKDASEQRLIREFLSQQALADGSLHAGS